MSLKRILGTMLATRMAGRGHRRGSLGTAALLGGLGRRRRGMGGKLGIAALGYMAYRAYQDHQARQGGGAAGGRRSGIGGIIQDVADRLGGGGTSYGGSQAKAPAGSERELQEQQQAAAEFSDDTALLLIRAMITAAYSDGALSQEERMRIMQEIEEAGADDEDRRIMEREIANPKPLDDLLRQVRDRETAQEFYLASRAAIDGETPQHRAYLSDLRQRLELTDEEASEVEELAS